MLQENRFPFWMNLVCLQVTLPAHKDGANLEQVITSEEVEVSKPLVSFLTGADH